MERAFSARDDDWEKLWLPDARGNNGQGTLLGIQSILMFEFHGKLFVGGQTKDSFCEFVGNKCKIPSKK